MLVRSRESCRPFPIGRVTVIRKGARSATSWRVSVCAVEEENSAPYEGDWVTGYIRWRVRSAKAFASPTMEKLAASLLLLLLAAGVTSQSCHLRELDLCAATLVLFNQSPTGVATTEPDLNRQCTYINEAEQCFKNFTLRCMTPLQRELLGFVSEGSEKLLGEYCTAGTELRANYLKHAPCLNDAHILQKDCLTDLQAGLEAISGAEFQKRIPMACCGYQRYMGCARDTVEKKCGKAAVDFMQLLLRNAVSRLPDIVCTGYGAENQECHKLLPEPGTQPQGSKSDSVLSRLFAAYLGN